MSTDAQLAAPGGAKADLDPRRTPLRCTSQELTTVATVAQMPREGQVPFGFAYDASPLDLPGAHESGDNWAVGTP